jgi:hypothetical protein
MPVSFAQELDAPPGAPLSLSLSFAVAAAPVGGAGVFKSSGLEDLHEEEGAEAREGVGAETLDLLPGQTPFAARMRNLIEAGRPDRAITKLETALSSATELTIGGILEAAGEALSLMQDLQHSEASVLRDILSGWGLNEPPKSSGYDAPAPWAKDLIAVPPVSLRYAM